MHSGQYQDKNDEQLAALAINDPHAFVPLVRRYEARLLAYIRRISGFSKEDAEDVLQEAFMDAYRHIASFDNNLKFSSWIYRITHNRTISIYRKKRHRLNNYSTDDEDLGFERILASNDDIQLKAEKTITKQKVKQILDQLPVRDKEVLILAYMEEKSYEEIGDILRAPMGTVATWIRRAKIKFAKLADKEKII